MIIDASLGRANCCAFPQPYPPQPVPPFPPQPPVPVPPTEPDAIQVVLATAQTAIANGAVIPLTGVVRQLGNGLSFNPATGSVAVNEAGVYVFQWNVLVQSAGDEAPVIALQSLDGQTVLGYSGIPAAAATDGAVISGTAIAALPAGTSWALVNATGAPLDVPVAGTAPAAFAASLTVYEIPTRQSGGRPRGFL